MRRRRTPGHGAVPGVVKLACSLTSALGSSAAATQVKESLADKCMVLTESLCSDAVIKFRRPAALERH